ncbi:MAG TPA: class I SAM-dependent methyltransferase [Actinomycetota bacterium]|nr:class I SAM-dependent methyltransferase [Actinomycetota bacterium]
MPDSVTFDRAVDYYDRTRALPPGVESAMAAAVGAELRDRGRVLEIGAGTGRIALPLIAAGVDVVGLDLSGPMLGRFAAKAESPAPLVQGDATQLPFRDGSFGAAYAVHVLHLIPRWKEAVRELTRVVRPGGVLLVSQGWWGLVAYLDVVEAFADAAGIELRHVGLNDEAELDAALPEATPRDLVRLEGTQTLSLREMLERLRGGLCSFTWTVDDAARARGADAAAEYAGRKYGSLEEPRAVPQEMCWRAYDLPG